MNLLMLSSKLFPKRIAIALFVLATVLVGTSMESHAQRFWRSLTGASGFKTNSLPAVQTVKPRIPQPVTGYGGNIHRNFIIRQQQKRSQAGGSLQYRGKVLWRR